MDANNQKFWLLAEAEQFGFAQSGARWDASRRVLRLDSSRPLPALPTDRALARTLAHQARSTRDEFGTWATLSSDRTEVQAHGTFEDSVTIYATAAGEQVLDFAMGDESVLYLLVGQPGVAARVVMIDRRERWSAVELSEAGFLPDLVALLPGGGAWLIDRRDNRLARLWGMPLRDRPLAEYAPGVVRPCRENGDPPSIELRDDLSLPVSHDVISLAVNARGELAILLWPLPETGDAAIALLSDNSLGEPMPLTGVIAPFSVGWVGRDRIALLMEAMSEALVFRLFPGAHTTTVVGERYPLNGWTQEPFCNAFGEPVHYPAALDGDRHPRPLYPLSLPGLARSAEVDCTSAIDGGAVDTEWHRIYIEASIPRGTGITLSLSAANERTQLSTVQSHPHCFGAVAAELQSGEGDVPLASWMAESSEIPFHPGLLDCPSQPQRAGLFSVLVQRSDRAVRSLRGRFLQLQVTLHGDGHNSPELAGIRIYGGRFSYLDHYLPELYRESLFGPPADAAAAAAGPDFLRRYLCLFESVLTPMEDKVAAAHLVTDPVSAPSGALEWLAQWVGLTLEPGLSVRRKRRMLAEATRLYRKRGTLRGLSLALNIATGDWVAQGGVVILEDYRLRRTFATILGADLADEEDPLLMGISASGNSYVGDTLLLGEREQRELLALFRPDTGESQQERKFVESFYERLANRVTVLVHREVSRQELGLIRRIVSLETPAHVETRVLNASAPLLVGLSSLVGVDTTIGEQASPQPVDLQRSIVGRGDYILGKGSLDPRLEGAGSRVLDMGRRPTAFAPDVASEFGNSFSLDATGSQAYGGREIETYHWSLDQGD